MIRRTSAVVGVLAVAATLLGPAGAQAASWHNCGSWGDHGNGRMTWAPEGRMVYGYGNFHLRTQRVSCTKARYLVLMDKTRWGRWNSADYKRQEFWRGPWYCWSRLTGYESGRTICRASSGRRVKWGTAS